MIAQLFYRCITLLFVSVALITAQGLKAERPYISGFHPLDEEPNEFSMLHAVHPVLLSLKTNVFIDTSVIDFEKRQITFRRTDPLGYTLWEYHYGELSEYLSDRKSFALTRDWKRASLSTMGADATASKHSVSKLQWELPVQYPTWAQRILGNEPPKLTIDGSLKLTIGFNSGSSKRADAETNSSGGFVLDEDYNFSVTGSVGRLINVNIKSSSANSFEFSENLQNFKIEYKESTPGELEDEIIQEVSAGYTGFDMPGTNLSGIIESKKGLFGIKIKSKFGPLMLTTIAATEQAEAASKTFSTNSGSGSQAPAYISAYAKNRFFYLDTLYRRDYIKKYGKGGNPEVNIAPRVDSLEVWIKSDGIRTGTASNSIIKNVFLTESDTSSLSTDSIRKSQSYKFQLLKKNTHYILKEDDGYIQFTDSLRINDNDQIAIYLRSSKTASGDVVVKGQYRDTLPILWTLKPVDVIGRDTDDPSRYYLMWRNVYEMPKTKDLTNLKLSVKKIEDDTAQSSNKDKANRYYAAIIGLSDEKGGPLTEYSSIYKGEDGLFIIPPFSSTSANGDLPFMNPELGDNVDSAIYQVSEQKRINKIEKFVIEGSGASKQTIFEMDFGIIANTEKVWADQVELVRDQDYVVNYDMGTLELLSLRAKAASSIKADYQLQSMFLPDKKVFLGVNGQVQLPFISDKSFIGGTLLYQDVKVSEAIPRLGQEPYSKLLYDLNTKIDLQPEWMTSLVNSLPLIETTAPSQVTLDVEVAHSRMNPNPDGQAYVDDFEDSKLADQLGNSDDSWYQASPSDSILKYFHNMPPAWDFYWFSPADWDNKFRIPKKELYVFDEKATTAAQEGYISALRLHCKPAPSERTLRDSYKKTWAGIMTPIPISFSNKTKEQYLEFYVRDDGRPGKLQIQMGEMREDLSLNGGKPNGAADKEDTSFTRTEEYSQDFDKSLDKGLDTLRNEKEIYYVPEGTGDSLVPLEYGDPRLGEFVNDPARDDWLEYRDSKKDNYRYKCKTENSTYLETEDINRNGTVETATRENYFNFTIDLSDTAAPYFDKDAKIVRNKGWLKVRLPLREDLPGYASFRTKSGDPQWDRIRMVRLIWSGFDTTNMDNLNAEHQLVIAEMGFVGNQWESKVDTTGAKIEAATISNKEGASYVSPMNVRIDQSTKEPEREQALQLTFKNLKRGQEVIVTKNTSYQKLNLTAYKSLNLKVYGKRKTGELANNPLSGGDLKFVFRFGTDSSTYYEYRSEIMPEWNNDINIDLQELAKRKDNYMVHNPDTTIADTIGSLRVKSPKGRQPYLSEIRWMALGVVREMSAQGGETDSGEIWVNEMILNGINSVNGWSARAGLQTDWADFFKFKTGMDYHNGNYRTMQDQTNTSQNSTMNANVNASLNLDKFLPKDLGISLPVGAQVSGSVVRPQLKNNDVSLSKNGKADNLTDMAGDAVRMLLGMDTSNFDRDSKLYAKQVVDRKFWTSYSKNSPSDNWLAGLLADRTTSSFSYSNRVSDNYQGRNPEGNSIYVITDTSQTYSGSLKYDLSPKDPPAWTKWKMADGDTGLKWLPQRLRDYEFSLLPSTFTFDLADANYTSTSGRDTKKSALLHTQNSFTVRHGFSMDYTPIAPLLKLNYGLTINRDLDTVAGKGLDSMLGGVFKMNNNGTWREMSILYGEKSRTQRAGLTLDPQIVDWLTSTVNYSSNYTGNISKRSADLNDYIDADVGLTFSFNSSLDLNNLLSSLTTTGKSGKQDSTMIAFKNGFNKLGLRMISFTYSANSGLQNKYLSSSKEGFGLYDFFLYQIGRKGRTLGDMISGNMDDEGDFGGMRSRIGKVDKAVYENDSRSVERSYRFSTGLDLTFPFEISFDPISLGWSTKFVVRPDSSKLDTTYSYPEFSIDARTPALMKVGFVADMFSNINLSSKMSYRQSIHRFMQARDTSNRFDLSPLISVSGVIKKWPISVNYSHRYSHEKNRLALTDNEKTTNGDELTLGYEIERNNRLSEIKVLYWTIPIKGKTTVGFKGTRETSESKTRDQQKPLKNLKLLLNPFLTYIFTENVNGTLQYSYTRDKDNTDLVQNNEFALVIDIRFR